MRSPSKDRGMVRETAKREDTGMGIFRGKSRLTGRRAAQNIPKAGTVINRENNSKLRKYQDCFNDSFLFFFRMPV